MSWEHLDSGRVNDKPLDLYRSDGDFMIRVDGYELMNSRWHRSERELANIARSTLLPKRPSILIAGLGLGFTLTAFLELLPQAELFVVEASTEVLRWYQTYFKRMHRADDSSVAFIHAQVQDHFLFAVAHYDLVVLDVDNGPEAMSGSDNSLLYTSKGLARLRSALRPRGSFLLWSAFPSQEFATTASASGFHLDCIPVAVGLREHQHFIYRGMRA